MEDTRRQIRDKRTAMLEERGVREVAASRKYAAEDIEDALRRRQDIKRERLRGEPPNIVSMVEHMLADHTGWANQS